MKRPIEVEEVEKTEDGGFVVVFSQGEEKHNVIFPESYVLPSGDLDTDRFLRWGAEAPFDWEKIPSEWPSVLVIADLAEQIKDTGLI